MASSSVSSAAVGSRARSSSTSTSNDGPSAGQAVQRKGSKHGLKNTSASSAHGIPGSFQASGPSRTPSAGAKWKFVRPWSGPAHAARSAEASLEDGDASLRSATNLPHAADQTGDEDLPDSGDELATIEQSQRRRRSAEMNAASTSSTTRSSLLASRHSSISSKRKMQLEVVDISSTSVSLAVYGPNSDGNKTGSSSSLQSVLPRESHAQSSRAHDSQNPPAAGAATTSTLPSFSVKLNSVAWPHVFQSDSSFLEDNGIASAHTHGSSRPASGQMGAMEDGTVPNQAGNSNILVWGLTPGLDYQIELGMVDEQEDANESREADEVSEDLDIEEAAAEPVSPERNVAPEAATEPDVPPPPYSSHDPGSPRDTSRDSENRLRALLQELLASNKQKESTLNAAIAALRRQNDKLTREDQRQRQRIHVLEDSTTRLKEVALDEDAERKSLEEAVSELSETEKLYITRLERRRANLEKTEKQAKEQADRDEAELAGLRSRLEKATVTEEAVLSRKLKYERESLPMYNIQLATLEADVRRMHDDQRRHFGTPPALHNSYVASPSQPSLMSSGSGTGRSGFFRAAGRAFHMNQNGPAGSNYSHHQTPQPVSNAPAARGNDDADHCGPALANVTRQSFEEVNPAHHASASLWNSSIDNGSASKPALAAITPPIGPVGAQQQNAARQFLPIGMRMRAPSGVQQAVALGSASSPGGSLSPSSTSPTSAQLSPLAQDSQLKAAGSRFNFNSSWASKVVGSGNRARKDGNN